MKIEELAAKIDAFSKSFDPYDYADRVENPEKNIEELITMLQKNDVVLYNYIYDIYADEERMDDATRQEAGKLYKEMEQFYRENEPNRPTLNSVTADGDGLRIGKDELLVEVRSSDMAIKINAEFECWFDVDSVFGTSTREDDSKWINFYTDYYPAEDKVHALLVICADNGDEYMKYPMTKKEEQLVLELMDKEAIKEGYASLDDMIEKEQSEIER